MRIGTKSVLFGAHCFFIHPFFVAAGWWKLYGPTKIFIGRNESEPRAIRYDRAVYTSIFDPRLWIAFVIHDLGYFGKPNMDGDEGERHPEWGAGIMQRLFG